jgi:hypothetical protein
LVFWQVDFNLDTWQDLILKEGFLTTEPTVWLFEGLVMYLTPAGVANLVETVAKVHVLPDMFNLSICSGQVTRSALLLFVPKRRGPMGSYFFLLQVPSFYAPNNLLKEGCEGPLQRV